MQLLLKKIINKFLRPSNKIKTAQELNQTFKTLGSVPWSEGYHEYKWQHIEESIHNNETLKTFEKEQLGDGFGKGIDERAIEYPWLLSHIQSGPGKLLDAGSTFNFSQILQHSIFKEKDIYIYTYYPEANNFSKNTISYIYGDLRELPFKDFYFDFVVCHSTLEHIGMNNSMYGYVLDYHKDSQTKNYDYLKVIQELQRITKIQGKILLTFPYGKFENHGFFQQFDAQMVQSIEDALTDSCTIKKSYALYENNGWCFTSVEKCNNSVSFNPHTGKGKGEDGAAHSRSICFVQICKNK